MVVSTKLSPRVGKNIKNAQKKNKKSLKSGKDEHKVDASKTQHASNKVNLIVQELKFIKLLAGNDTKIGSKQIAKLKKWLNLRTNSSFPFEVQDQLRIWKGLFYCMWMADKPLPQEKLADDLASIVHAFDKIECAIEFFGSFLQTMCLEWFGIDQWRIDKFMMLVRRVTRQMFVVLHKLDWDEHALDQFNAQLEKTVLNPSASIGFFMHFTDIYLEEIAKVSGGNVPLSSISALIKPYAVFVGKQRDFKLSKYVVSHIFNNLLFQSDLGREYKEKFEAWKSLGFPGQCIDDLELVEKDGDDDEDSVADDDEDSNSDNDETAEESVDNENEENPLDPRAGNVDVIMPEIQFDADEIVQVLENVKKAKYTNVRTRYTIKKLIHNFSSFASGKFPIGIQKININDKKLEMPKIDNKVNELVQFEKKLYGNSLKNMSKKKRRKTLKSPNVANLAQQANIKRKVKKTVLLTAAEKKKINQWDEENISANDLTKLNSSIVESPQDEWQTTVEKNTIVLENDITPASSTPKTKKKNLKRTTEKSPFNVDDEWSKPLQDGEIEFFVPSRKKKLLEVNEELKNDLVLNPLAIRGKKLLKEKALASTPTNSPKIAYVIGTPHITNTTDPAPISTPIRDKLAASVQLQSSTATPSSEKKVKIMLQLNRSQDTSEYFKQLRSSPNVPYDSTKKPSKGLLKPNLLPSPINPYYKRKLGI